MVPVPFVVPCSFVVRSNSLNVHNVETDKWSSTVLLSMTTAAIPQGLIDFGDRIRGYIKYIHQLSKTFVSVHIVRDFMFFSRETTR